MRSRVLQLAAVSLIVMACGAETTTNPVSSSGTVAAPSTTFISIDSSTTTPTTTPTTTTLPQLAYGTPIVTGTTLPTFGAGIDGAAGSPIPPVVGQSFDGSEVRIDPTDGRAKVIVFLAHWCPYSRNEVPVIRTWLEENRLPAGVDLIAVATATREDRTNFPPADWLTTARWPAAVLVDDQANQVAGAFGLNAFPFFVVVGSDGLVVERLAGAIPAGEFERLLLSVAPQN